MSKRIFTDRQTHPPTTEQGRVPNCYYHKLPITHFCTKKKCTLPLCQECLPIHKKEHVKEKEIAMEGIIEFESARIDSLNAFSQRKNEIQAIQQKFKSKVVTFRNSIVETLDKVLDRFFQDSLITDGNIEILKQIHQRINEIKGGSLKELIRYYQDIYGAEHFRKLYKMYSGDYLNNFKFELNKQKIEQLISAGIINTALKTSNPEIRQQHEGINLSISEYNEQTVPFNIEVHKTNHINFTKHIPTEEQEESEISSYPLLKSKKQHNTVYTNNMGSKMNIYTHPNNRMQEPLTSVPSSNISHSSKSKSLKRKGLSLSKSHQYLHILSQENFKVEDEKNISPDRRSNWRNFINMGQKKPQQHTPTQPQYAVQRRHEVNTVLNPRQMRQLLAKKKSEQKYKVVVRRQPNMVPQLSQRS